MSSVAYTDSPWQDKHQKTEATDHPKHNVERVWNPSVRSGRWGQDWFWERKKLEVTRLKFNEATFRKWIIHKIDVIYVNAFFPKIKAAGPLVPKIAFKQCPRTFLLNPVDSHAHRSVRLHWSLTRSHYSNIPWLHTLQQSQISISLKFSRSWWECHSVFCLK